MPILTIHHKTEYRYARPVAFGEHRVMYGGDWPVSELAGPYTAWIETLDWATAGCTVAEKRKLFRDNAIRIYRLS